MACFPTSCQELTCRDAPPRVPDFPELTEQTTTIETATSLAPTGTDVAVSTTGDHSSSVATDLTPSGTFKTAPTFMTTPVTDDHFASTSQGLIIGLSICGSIIVIVLLAVGIWWLWKTKKACFDTGSKSDSQTALAASVEKDVELIKIRQGAVVLQPRPEGGEAEENQDKPPAAEVQPSNPVISTSEPANDTKKKKMKRQNRVTPEPQPPVQTAELPPVQTAETHSREA